MKLIGLEEPVHAHGHCLLYALWPPPRNVARMPVCKLTNNALTKLDSALHSEMPKSAAFCRAAVPNQRSQLH